MKAGRMIYPITVERSTSEPNEYGTPVMVWQPIAQLRAEIVQQTTEEFLRNAGVSDETAIVFRTRHADNITNADRIIFAGQTYDIREVKQVGHRKGLELRATAHEGGQ